MLKLIYGRRFSQLVFLCPYYSGDDSDVISVYENSYQFPGYILQAYEKIVARKSDYFFFISDDVLLNPSINEDNIVEVLELNK